MTMSAHKHIDLTVVTFNSRSDFESTRTRFDERIPLLDPRITANLVISQAAWSEVEAAITPTLGPSGFLAVSRVDQGSLMSLRRYPIASDTIPSREPIDCNRGHRYRERRNSVKI